jgi:hypothetical protein
MLDDYQRVLQTHNAPGDLDAWYNNHGPGTQSHYPVFEEFQDNIG